MLNGTTGGFVVWFSWKQNNAKNQNSELSAGDGSLNVPYIQLTAKITANSLSLETRRHKIFGIEHDTCWRDDRWVLTSVVAWGCSNCHLWRFLLVLFIVVATFGLVCCLE